MDAEYYRTAVGRGTFTDASNSSEKTGPHLITSADGNTLQLVVYKIVVFIISFSFVKQGSVLRDTDNQLVSQCFAERIVIVIVCCICLQCESLLKLNPIQKLLQYDSRSE